MITYLLHGQEKNVAIEHISGKIVILVVPDCSDYNFILDNKFTCSNHSNEPKDPNIYALLRCIAVVAQMVSIPYPTFKKMEKKIEEAGKQRGIKMDF